MRKKNSLKYAVIKGKVKLDLSILKGLNLILPPDVSGLRTDAVAFVHHSLWLVVDDLPVIIALPCTVVLLERCSSKIIQFFNISSRLELVSLKVIIFFS